jgi:hypothetical protein
VDAIEGDTEEGERRKIQDEEAIVEEQARELAAATLRKVLQPSGNVTAEKALKQTLRSLGVVTASNSDNNDSTNNNHAAEIEHQQRRLRQLRQRVSILVLGTSIFRLRHEYVYNVTILQQQVVIDDNDTDNDDSECDNKIRAMVDLHAAYLLEDESDNNSGNDDNSDDNAIATTAFTAIPWPVHDPVQCLSLQYSMPEFIVQSWITEYGVHETRQICRAANQPGPVTLRRNVYQCPSDEMLMSRLARDHNVTLVPMMMKLRHLQ